MAKLKTTRWDIREHLDSPERIAGYLEAAFEDGDPTLIAAAIGDVAHATGMSRIARDAGLGREGLYKSLSADGNPAFATVLEVLRALGLELRAVPVGR